MTQPIAYLNGKFIPNSEAHVALDDVGFVHGAAVVERLRTFDGALFRLPEHLARLRRSLAIVGIDDGPTDEELRRAAEEVASRNYGLLSDGQELGVVMVVTPGRLGWFTGTAEGPTVCVHSQRLPVERWAEQYRSGAALASVSVVQPPAESWPAELKCRSRMHFYLAERQAAAKQPGAWPLLCDAAGRVTESSIANVVISPEGTHLVSPPGERILPGVTLAATRELAASLGIPWEERNLTPADVARATEVWLTSTPWCVLPVTQFDGQRVGNGRPGALYQRMQEAWNELVGYDIAARAEQVRS